MEKAVSASYPRPAKATLWLRVQVRLLRWLSVALRLLLVPRAPRGAAPVTYFSSGAAAGEGRAAAGPLRRLVFRPPADAPPGNEDKVLVDFHGGGFAAGAPEDDAEFCAFVARTVGCVAVSAQYRFAPEHPYPAGLRDCLAAAEWARDEFRAKRVAVIGFSAGGTLALGVAQLLARAGKPAVAAAALYSPIDFSPRSKSEFDEKNPWIRNFFHEAYLLGAKESDLTDPLLSPFYASPDELPATTVFVIPEHDPNRPDMVEFCDRMKKEKPQGFREVFVPGCFHGWDHVPSWILGKEKTAKKWEVYDIIAAEVRRAFERP